MHDIRGVLLDLQGVLYLEGESVDGAPQAVRSLVESGLGLRFLTNTTTRPRSDIVRRMTAMGFELETAQVFTPAMAAVRRLAAMDCKRLHLVTEPDLAEDFAGFELVGERPDAVVMGDLYKGFDWPCLNSVFDDVRRGAVLVALHRNRYCRRGAEIALDLGPFVAAIEYAADVEAVVVGKPDRAFFELALDDLGVADENAVMVGDDPFSDIDGAAAAGLRTVQVRTGKYAPDVHGNTAPDAVIDSIACLPGLLRP